MSKEPVRRQWADDDEDDDREVNNVLTPFFTLLLNNIYILLTTIKHSEHRTIVTERIKRHRQGQNYILCKRQKSEGTETFIYRNHITSITPQDIHVFCLPFTRSELPRNIGFVR